MPPRHLPPFRSKALARPTSTAFAGRAADDWCDITVDARTRRSLYLGAFGRHLAATILGRAER